MSVSVDVTNRNWEAAAATMKHAAGEGTPFSSLECDSALASLKALIPVENEGKNIDWGRLRSCLKERAHLAPKDWPVTSETAAMLEDIFGTPNTSEAFQKVFDWVLEGGNWHKAKEAAKARPAAEKPWVVLVMGVNGIRKTTSVYQRWVTKALSAALGQEVEESSLPSGSNSFFRQLDYMVATLANDELQKLYKGPLCADGMGSEPYSKYKDAVFARYRTIAEALGILLLNAAKVEKMNVMVETSGRDIASFAYIERFFPEESQYRKLVLNFSIDDIMHAEQSVDVRMKREMRNGRAAVIRNADASELVRVNAGGPYGSAVLKGINAQSQQVWYRVNSTVIHGECEAGTQRSTTETGGASGDKSVESRAKSTGDGKARCYLTWSKAHIAIHGNESPNQWYARAVFNGLEVEPTYSYVTQSEK